MSAWLPARRMRGHGRQSGLSYVEVLVSIVVVAAALAPAMEALRNGASAVAVLADQTIDRERLVSRLEQVAASRYAVLDAAAAESGHSPTAASALFSDAPGTAGRIVVQLYRYDGTAATTADTGLLRLDAAIEGSTQALSTLRLR